jgi:tetratricopeptide (TPR) repeat protein
LRLIRTDGSHRIDVAELEQNMEADRRHGLTPFLIVGTAGTVDIGATDDLTALARVAQKHNVWFHIDGAYAALAMLAPDLAPGLKGIEYADSLAFDFHKWAQVPYAAGFLLVRHGLLHRHSFARSAAYLRREDRGLAGGSAWPCDFGVDLSRGFQALKTWFTLKVYGTDALGAVVSQTCALARYLEERIRQMSELELMAPVQLNIVCFRFRAVAADQVNASIAVDLQEAGEVAPSTTILDGQLAIRVAIVNHRTTRQELDLLLERTLLSGRTLSTDTEESGCAPPNKRRSPHSLALVPQKAWEPRRLREIALAELEKQLAAEPDAIGLRVDRAGLLGELGRTEEAKKEYLAVLAQDPAHRVALNMLGTLLYGTGYRSAARTAYAEAVARHPDDVESLVNLANVLTEDGEMARAREHYAAALRSKPGAHLAAHHLAAHQGMARVLAELGEEPEAEAHRRAGYAGNALASLPYRGDKPPVNLLLLVSALGGNIPVRHLLDDRIFQTHVLTADYFSEKDLLPLHDVVFNSIGDADLAHRALSVAESILARTAAPFINTPHQVSITGRVDNARRLRGLPGIVTPLTATLPRDLLESSSSETALARHGFEFPLLLRWSGPPTGLSVWRSCPASKSWSLNIWMRAGAMASRASTGPC